jgi:FKBP-type peptidyl-prolyl cis-trans isomerase FkpA
MMNKLPLIVWAALLASCGATDKGRDGFMQTASGFDYKIIRSPNPGDSIRLRDVVKVQLHQYIDDSLMVTNRGKMPEYVSISGKMPSFDYTEILRLLRVNDSAVCLFPTSKIIERADSGAAIPAFLKKGQYVKVFLKVLANFREEAEAMADMEKTQDSLTAMSKEDINAGLGKAAKAFDSLIRSLPQKPVRLPSGVYVQVTQKGSGPKVQKEEEVSMTFKGTLLNGTVFDVATKDRPLTIHAGINETFEGFDAAISSLSFGDKAMIYIPAPLAYGARKAGDAIPAFSNLIFEVEILAPTDKKK